MATEATTADNKDISIFYDGTAGAGLASPVINVSGDGVPYLFFASSQTGEIFKKLLVDEVSSKPQEATVFQNSDGQPTGLAWDTKDNVLYVTDLAYKAVLTIGNDGTAVRHVGEYEKKSLKGPNSAVFDKKGKLYFADSGSLGDTSLSQPKGSVFVIEGGPSGALLKPLALECLACPMGLTVADNDVVYVCETLRNRVLRFVRTDTGAWIPTVWRQFSGLLGPVGVACKELKNGSHCVIVARSGAPGADKFSVVSVLDGMGNTVKDIQLPSATCSGIAFGTKGDAYVTAAHQIYQVKL